MSFKTIWLLGVAMSILVSVLAAPVFAQEQNSSATHQGAPATQSSTAAGAAAGSESPASPAKRVWTNDDMGNLHRNSVISTFSGSGNKLAKTPAKPATGAKNKGAKWYQDQITAQRAKIPALDDKISQLQSVLNGDTVQATRTYGGARIDDWHEELVNLKKQRDDIETKISSLQDEARHNGIPENQIPQ